MEEDCDSVVICPMSSARTGVETFQVAVGRSRGLRVQSEVMVEKAVGVGPLDQATMHAVERTLFFVLGSTE
jgi:mRNA-degrading endonuclease toxin of MazEF toxin-antitoxin module